MRSRKCAVKTKSGKWCKEGARVIRKGKWYCDKHYPQEDIVEEVLDDLEKGRYQ